MGGGGGGDLVQNGKNSDEGCDGRGTLRDLIHLIKIGGILSVYTKMRRGILSGVGGGGLVLFSETDQGPSPTPPSPSVKKKLLHSGHIQSVKVQFICFWLLLQNQMNTWTES